MNINTSNHIGKMPVRIQTTIDDDLYTQLERLSVNLLDRNPNDTIVKAISWFIKDIEHYLKSITLESS